MSGSPRASTRWSKFWWGRRNDSSKKPTRTFSVDEKLYRIDLELYDRFEEFSKERLQLSLAALGAFGVFLTLLSDDKTAQCVLTALHSGTFKWLASPAVFLLGISAGCSMGHRFFASDGMYHHIRVIRWVEADPEVGADTPARSIASEESRRNEKLHLSERLLYLSAVTLVLGAMLLAIALLTLF